VVWCVFNKLQIQNGFYENFQKEITFCIYCYSDLVLTKVFMNISRKPFENPQIRHNQKKPTPLKPPLWFILSRLIFHHEGHIGHPEANIIKYGQK